MIKLCIVYPAAEGSFFDFDHYLGVHMPLAEARLKDYGFCGYEVQRGTGTLSGGPAPFLCITWLAFGSLEGLQRGMAAHGAELRADFARYTNIAPVVTVCEVAAAADFG